MMKRLLLLVAIGLLAGAAPAPAEEGDRLPDLDQMVPEDLAVKAKKIGGKRVLRLGFSSAAANVGAGPLTLHGYRARRKVPDMRVDQLVDRYEGPSRLVRDVGRMTYVVHPDHKHWHFVDFERYELRSRDGKDLIARDRKTGFCLGDRFPLPRAETLGAFSPTPLQGDTCGLGQPGLTGLFAGISVGWADQYGAQLEGQYIDVTRVPTGTYVLVHRLNLEDRIAESKYSNNASSVRFRLIRRGRAVPRVKELRRCGATAHCPPARKR